MNDIDNIARIRAVYHALEELADKTVFVGGATVSLYADRPTSEVRVTDDVDVVIELLKYAEFANIEAQLREKGFVNDVESGVICRYKINGIIVDVMPSQENILGFNNQWYPDGIKYAITHLLDENIMIKIFTAPLFIASKVDAFNDRGNKDGRFSSDFEDIVYVLNNRSTIWEEMDQAPEHVKDFLKGEFKKLTETNYLEEWISSHLDYHEQRRAAYIIGGLINFVT